MLLTLHSLALPPLCAQRRVATRERRDSADLTAKHRPCACAARRLPQSAPACRAMAAPSARRTTDFFAPAFCRPACPSRDPLAPRAHSTGDAPSLTLATPAPKRVTDFDSLSARLASAAEALSRTATPVPSPSSSSSELALPDVDASDGPPSALPMIRTSSHRTELPRRPALRVSRSEPTPRIVRFADGEVAIGLTWAVDDGDRSVCASPSYADACSCGPPPVARLSMREAIELQAVKAAALGTSIAHAPPSAAGDVAVDIYRGL